MKKISEADQEMLQVRLLRLNYSLLYTYLTPAKLMPQLLSKSIITCKVVKEMESYPQRCAQSSLLISSLFEFGHKLLKLCNILSKTPGQEHIARKVFKGM